MSVFQRPFLDILAELRRGKTAGELTEEMHKLIATCADTGKKGQITLTLTVEPDKNSDGERWNVSDQITVKTPRRTVKPSMCFLSDDGNLTRTDPRQGTFEGLRDVSAPATDDEAASAAGKKA